MKEEILRMVNITKSFNQVTVLENVDFDMRKGEVHALVGENGAGKSTLMKILAGVYQPDSGKIFINNEEVKLRSPIEAKNKGISIIYQEFSLIPTLSISYNIFLGKEPKNRFGIIDRGKMVLEAKKVLEKIGLNLKSESVVGDLSTGNMQQVEIAKAILENSKILIMDEPTSALTEAETEKLFNIINLLKEKGTSIIYITHRMKEIFQICDRITVLRDGKKVLTSEIKDTSLQDIIRNMTGRNKKIEVLREGTKALNKQSKTPLLEVKNLSSSNNFSSVNFNLFPGEVLGITGLLGSGKTELAQTIFGIEKKDFGEIIIKGDIAKIKSPKDAMNYGIGLIPENRRTQGLILNQSIKTNAVLPSLKRFCNFFIIREKEVMNTVKGIIRQLKIKSKSLNEEVRFLSGGNQQKVVIGKWLIYDPDILIMDEPTIGVDVGAKSEIIEIIKKMAEEGKGVIVISSELNELLAVSDRIIVMSRGKMVKELQREEIENEEELQRAIQTA